MGGRTTGRAWGLFAILVAVGTILCGGGIWLVWLGGSAYYVIAGVLTLACAIEVFRKSRTAIWVYAALLVVTTVWAFAEVGVDGWALAPRLIAPFVLGLWLLLPHVRKTLIYGRHGPPAVIFGLAIIGAIGAGMALHKLLIVDPIDPVYRAGTVAQASGLKIQVVGASPDGQWLHYGGSQGGARFSPLSQITRANVDQLQQVWTYDVGKGPPGAKPAMEATPLMVGDTLYTCTGYNDVIALDPETGREKWRFRSRTKAQSGYGSCRGVAYYRVPIAGTDCPERIITATVDARLIALDARTGRVCRSFGSSGIVDLLKGMSKAPPGYYFVSSMPTIIRGRIVVGGWVSDNEYVGEPSGVIRAYDATTGRFAWAFDMGRPDKHDEPASGETYTPGTPNSWAPMSADEELGLIYAPTGNAGPDSYGGQRRPFDDAYSTSILAIDANTGALRWSFQTLHHDLWDHDVASQPVLVDLTIGGRARKALIQATKHGEIFMLDRTTGKPIMPVRELPSPTKGAVPGERVSPTQPASIALPSFRGPNLVERRAWGLTPLDQLYCRIKLRAMNYQGPHTPPGFTDTIIHPGSLGAINWGSVSIDTRNGLMLVNSTLFNGTFRLMPRAEADRRGLVPAGYSKGKSSNHQAGDFAMAGTPYGGQMGMFWSPLLVPCVSPPYGMISAVDLATGKLLWHHPWGTARESGPLAIPSRLPFQLGAPNMGGSVATAGGLLFIGASQDAYMRAFDLRTGEEVWRADLPAGGQATPLVYRSQKSGREFVVISAGGSATMLSPLGTKIVAFALPKGR